MAMPVAEMNISKFLREAGPALAEVEQHDLRLNRRDGSDLYVTLAAKAEAEHEMLAATGQILAQLVVMHPEIGENLPTVMERAFPWSRFLPEGDRSLLAQEFIETVEAAGSLNNYAAVGILLKQWKNTAEVWADPLLRSALEADIEEGPVVERPAVQ